MARRPRTTDDNDSPWKEALQLYLPHFLAFFFPDIHRDIDWPRGYQALDKEFQQIQRRAKVGKRLADKLFKVWLKDGGECWLLIHVEIQGDYEKEFPQRMFEYHVAIRQLYNQDVASLALLCDDRPKWRPQLFSYERWGCRVDFPFRVAKLLDQLENREALEASDNPIAAVVLADLEAMQTRNDPARRMDQKLQLAKGLLLRDWAKDDIREVLRLIDWLMTLPEDLEEAFQTEVHEFEKEKTVAFVTSFERFGIKKGLKEGRKEGVQKGLLEAIGVTLHAKFGPAGSRLLPRVRTLDLFGLRRFMRLLTKAETLDEVREYLK